ncbi:hypothetical protein TrLO_g2891 [Triparma laevis f. longispina]|uniref:Uncharacterized protein n=1 Tax=Triparma laevis f. longispina TaxID=1714387 RepID=A0A9W7FRZ1_9STRA|nr:hypothetical protein TrLO_g2891 [Triparma laevis f. longispina]
MKLSILSNISFFLLSPDRKLVPGAVGLQAEHELAAEEQMRQMQLQADARLGGGNIPPPGPPPLAGGRQDPYDIPPPGSPPPSEHVEHVYVEHSNIVNIFGDIKNQTTPAKIAPDSSGGTY